jgi:hypothetical protein
MADGVEWQPITDPNDPRLQNTPLNPPDDTAIDFQPHEAAPAGPAIDFQPHEAAPGIDFQPPPGDPGLAQIRASYAHELNDPELIGRVYSLTHREVGSQGPEAQQAFLETVFNRAAARGKTLRETVSDPHYYPGVSLRPASLSPEEFDRYQQLALNVAQGGSNISGYATGNASGRVGFAGGPQTFRAGGERFGIEGPDRHWVPYGTPVMPAEAVSGGLASAPSGEQIRQMIGEQPEAALGASRGAIPIYRPPKFYTPPKFPKGLVAPQAAPSDPNAAVATNGQYPKALPVAPGETTPIIGPAHPVIDFVPDPAPLNLPGAQVIEPEGVAPPMLAAPEGDFPRATAVIPEELGVTGFPYGGLGNPLPTPTGGVPIDFQPLPEAQQPDWTTGVGHAQGAADTTPEAPVEEPPEAASIFPPELTNLLTDLWKGGVRKTAEAAVAIHPAVATLRAIPATRPIGEGLVEGGGKVAEGFVGDPDNLALIAATEGLGLVPGAAGTVASKAVSTYFSAQLASQLPEVWQAFKDAPDLKSKTSIAAQGISQLLMAAAATKHAVSEGPIPGAVGPIKAEAGEAAAPPAAAAAPAAKPAGEFGFEEIKVPGAEPAPAAAPEAAPAPAATEPAPAAPDFRASVKRFNDGETDTHALHAADYLSEWNDWLRRRSAAKTPKEENDLDIEAIRRFGTDSAIQPDIGWNTSQKRGTSWDPEQKRFVKPEGKVWDEKQGKYVTPAPAAAEPAEAAPAPAAAAPAEAPGSAWKGVPFMSADRMKTQLEAKGYSSDQIEGMTRSDLDAITAGTGGPEPAGQPAPAAEPAPATPPEPAGPAPGVLPAPSPISNLPSAAAHPTLPRELSGAKPRYSYGNKQFQLQFESDLDKAAYISAQARRSKADARYVQFVADHTGLTEKEIRAHGEEVKARIKDRAKAGTGDSLTVPNTIDTVLRRKANAEMQTQQVEQIRKLGGIDILDAVIKEGGFPARGTKGYEMLSGELRRLADAARGAKHYGQSGVLMGKLFNKSSKGTDALLLRVRAHGFDVEHPAALIDRTIKRILSGEPDMELPDKAEVLHGPAMKHSADEPQLRLGQAPNSENLHPDPRRAALRQVADNDPGVIAATKRLLGASPQTRKLRDALLAGGRIQRRGSRIFVLDNRGQAIGHVDPATGGLSVFEDVPIGRFEKQETHETGMPQRQEKVEQYAGLTTKPPVVAAHGPRFEGDTYAIINGHHRYEAALRRGAKTLRTDSSVVDQSGTWLSVPRAGQESGIPDYAARLKNTIAAIKEAPVRFARDEPGFEFAKPESVEEQKARIAAEKAAAEARATQGEKAARVKYGWKQALTGTTGDLGQGSLIGAPEDLFAPPAPKPAETYEAISARTTAASREFAAATQKYRARQIGDAEFLAAKAKHDAAQADFDKAFTAEQRKPTPIPAAPAPAPEQADFQFQKDEAGGRQPQIEIKKSQQASVSHGRGSDSYRTPARHDILIDGTLRGKLWGRAQRYMEPARWETATINPDNTGIRTLRSFDTKQKAIDWIHQNPDKFAPPPPEQADFKFQKGEGSVAPGSTRRYTLPDETRQRFQPAPTEATGFSGLRWHVGSQTGIPVEEVHIPGVSDVAGRIPRTSGERSVAQAHRLAELYSDGLSWYRGENGAHVPVRGVSDGSRIYLHADMLDGPTSQPVHLVAAHEITHVMQNLHPDLYGDLLKHADTTRDSAYKENRLAKGYSEEQLQHEAVADLVADTLADPYRMRQAMGETPGLFARLASYIRDFIDHTIRKLGPRKDATASGLVDNLKAARADVMKALQAVRERRAGEAKPPEYHYSLDEPPSQGELEAAAAGNDKEKMRGHVATVQRMTQASPDVKSMVESWYTPLELGAINHQANASIDKLGLGPSTDLFMNSRTTDANTMALGHNLAVRLDEQGHFEDAAMVRDKMAEKLTTPAQSLWYISTIAKTSPEGLIRTAQKLMTDQVKADPEKAKLLEEIERLRAQLGKLPEDQQGPATKIVIQQIGKSTRKGQIVSPEKLNELLDKHGQGKLGPDDLAQALTKYFKIPRLTPENIAKIKAAQKAWAAVPADNPLLKLKRGADMMDSVYSLVPRSIWDKIRATSVISMILHGKLPVRIGVSNAIRMAGQTLVDTIQNVPADMGNIFRGRSTVTGAQLKGIVEGLSTPVRAYRAGYKDARLRGLATVPSFREGVRTLIDLANLTTRGLYDTTDVALTKHGFREAIKITQGSHTFSSRFGRLFEDAVTLVHNTVPYGFWEAGFKSSLYRQMKLAGMETPTSEMIANAQIDGNKAIFYNDTAMYNSLMAVRKALDLPTAKITQGKYGLGTATIPFAKVPSALLTEGLAWTPFGLTKAGWEIVRPFVTKEPFRAKEVGDAIIKAALGTGSTMLAGYQLAKIGVLTGAPDDNRDLDAMRRASGWGGFKINVTELKRRMTSGNWWKRSATPDEGDVIVNYNWLEPIAFPLAMGADIAKSQDKREIDLKRGRITSNAVVSAMGAGLQSLTEAPMLRGVEEVIRDVGGGSWGKAATGIVANVPGNFIPSLVRQTSQYMDNTVRETRGGTLVEQEANAIIKQIPGLSKRYPPRYDVFGEAMQRYNYGNATLLNVFFNPAMVSHFKTNPGMAEMQRIYEKTGSSSGMASEVPAKLMINGKQVQLTNDQVAAYQRYVGKESSAVITRLLASPQFAAEPVTIKQNVMAQVLSAVNTAAKVDLFGHAPIQAGLGLKGPVVRGPSPLEVGALLEARRSGLNRPGFVQPQPAASNVPLWKLAPPPALPSLEP